MTVDIDDNEDVSSNLGGIFEPAPMPDAADLVAKMAPPVEHPDLLAPAPSQLQLQLVKLSQTLLKNTEVESVVHTPKPRPHKAPVLPLASLGSSLGEVVSDDDGLNFVANTSLKVDLPAAPSPTALAVAAEASNLPQDLQSLGDLDSMNVSMNVPSKVLPPSNVSMLEVTEHKAHVVAASLGSSLGEAMPSDDLGTSEPKAGTAQPASTDSQDSFLDESLDEVSQIPPRRSVDRAREDASLLHALDSEVQKGAAASSAEINAAVAESEAGASNVVLPTVPLWGA